MGWMQELDKVHDVLMQLPESEREGLMPVGFIKKTVKYLIEINADGTFSNAYDLSGEKNKNGVIRMIPSTPQAESRTGRNGVPFPLSDQLKYFVYDGMDNPKLNQYLQQLSDWCEQEDAPEILKVVHNYLQKKTLLQDMRNSGLDVQFNKDDEKKDADGKDAKVFVNFSVKYSEDIEPVEVCAQRDVQQSWSKYFAKQSESAEKTLCYVTGEQRVPLKSHPKVKGNQKLISSEDNGYPFRYKGRFVEDGSAATVSVEASIKAHNALNWLLNKQGFREYGLNIVAWNVPDGPIRVPLTEPENGENHEGADHSTTFQQYAYALRDATNGRMGRLRNFQEKEDSCPELQQRVDKTVIMGMEGATDGRMSIDYYQELEGNTYAERLRRWYETCCWETYNSKSNSWKIFTPTSLMVAKAVLGEDSVARARQDIKCEKSDAKQMRNLYKRLLSCMVSGQALPRDMVNSAVHRAEFPLSFQMNDSWSRYKWEKCIQTTCALVRKFYADRDSLGSIPDNRLRVDLQDRSYLYGRLFAVADAVERLAENNTSLPTNAIRLMRLFVQRPAETWNKLHVRLIPYLRKVGLKQHAGYYQKIISQIEQMFIPEQRMSNSPVTEMFLIGLYAQNRELFTEKEQRIMSPAPITFYTPERNRSELFGCLLAIADCIERRAESRTVEGISICEHDGNTQALRNMSRFIVKPADTWMQIHDYILPYMQKMGVNAVGYYEYLFHQVESYIDPQERFNNAPLDSMALHGYYCMRQCILTKDCRFQVDEIEKKTTSPCREELYGKLLALENRIERCVLDAEKTEDENRFSNAIRFMRVFYQKPESNWNYLEERLRPYEKKLRKMRFGWARFFRTQIDALKQQLEENQWNIDAPLQASWLHYYYVNY